MLEWRIYPTAVKAAPHDPLEAFENNNQEQVLSRSQRDQEEIERPQGPVSREQLFHDLLKDRRREIHVEDFLWTGSGKPPNSCMQT